MSEGFYEALYGCVRLFPDVHFHLIPSDFYAVNSSWVSLLCFPGSCVPRILCLHDDPTAHLPWITSVVVCVWPTTPKPKNRWNFMLLGYCSNRALTTACYESSNTWFIKFLSHNRPFSSFYWVNSHGVQLFISPIKSARFCNLLWNIIFTHHSDVIFDYFLFLYQSKRVLNFSNFYRTYGFSVFILNKNNKVKIVKIRSLLPETWRRFGRWSPVRETKIR